MPLVVRERVWLPRPSLEAVLQYAWHVDAFTVGEAMDSVALSRSTTIEALDDLVRVGLLRELPNARATDEYSKGRPSRRFELREDVAVVVAVDAGQTHVTVCVADLRGHPVVSTTEPLAPGTDSACKRRRSIASAVDAALTEAGRGHDDVLAVCVGVPAPVDREGHSPRHRDDFWVQMNPDLAEEFSAWAPIVRVENDASLASIAEHAAGAAVGFDDTVTLLAGDRLGSGVVIDGHLLRGAHGGVGELVVVKNLIDVDQAHGFGYQLAAWAAHLVATRALPGGHPLLAVPDGRLTGRVVAELAREGDDTATELVRRLGPRLARIAGLLGSLYNPERVIVSGAIAAGIEPALEVAREVLPGELDLPAPELVASTLGADVVSLGAIAAALESARAEALHLPRMH